MTTAPIAPTAKRSFRLPAFGPVLAATIVLFVVCIVLVPNTVNTVSLRAMVPYAAVLAIAAVGQTFVVQQRGIDLSVGGVVSLAAVGVPTLGSRYDLPFPVAVVVIALACAVVGVVNGILVTRLSITPLVATLAMNAVLVGVVAALTGGGSQSTAQPQLVAISTTPILGQPGLVWIALVFVIVVAVVSARTVIGRRFVAAGANPLAANVSSVSVTRNVMAAYVGAALSYGLAGVLLGGYLNNPGVTVGQQYILAAIATVIVGGTALTGVRGTIVGSAIAAVFLTQLVQAVLTLGAPSSIQLLIQALAIAVAAILQGVSRLNRRRQAPRPERTPTVSVTTIPKEKQ